MWLYIKTTNTELSRAPISDAETHIAIPSNRKVFADGWLSRTTNTERGGAPIAM